MKNSCLGGNDGLSSFFNAEINSCEEYSVAYISVDNELFVSVHEMEKQLKTPKEAVQKRYLADDELKKYAQYIFVPERNRRVLCFNQYGIFMVSMMFNSDSAAEFRKNITKLSAKLQKREFDLRYQAGFWQGKIAMRNEYQSMN